jgi:hypothetical protein
LIYPKEPGKEAKLCLMGHALMESRPATLTITAQSGEIAFGAVEAGLEVEYARDSIGFHWAGCEEGDEVEGEGTAELLDDGTIEPTETATKPSSKQNETLLQQPVRPFNKSRPQTNFRAALLRPGIGTVESPC